MKNIKKTSKLRALLLCQGGNGPAMEMGKTCADLASLGVTYECVDEHLGSSKTKVLEFNQANAAKLLPRSI